MAEPNHRRPTLTTTVRLPRPPRPDLAETALFLDVDGTLLGFAETPDAVVVTPALRELLAALYVACDRALALVSGRTAENLTGLFAPLELPLAGSHGLELALAGERIELATPLAGEHVAALRKLADAHPGSLLETKPLSASLHYRRAPHHAEVLTREMRALSAALGDGFRLLEGNHVLELVPARGDKGTAIDALCERTPWRGRTPVFVGDDTTDEPGFRAVSARGGHAIRVGYRGRTDAQWQLDSVAEVQAWLRALLAGRQ